MKKIRIAVTAAQTDEEKAATRKAGKLLKVITAEVPELNLTKGDTWEFKKTIKGSSGGIAPWSVRINGGGWKKAVRTYTILRAASQSTVVKQVDDKPTSATARIKEIKAQIRKLKAELQELDGQQ